MRPPSSGTITPPAHSSPETREAMLDAVRDAKGRGAIHPAKSLADAVRDVEAYLVVPAWSAGETAAGVAADVLRSMFRVEPTAEPFAWALYTEAARRLGFDGIVPVPTWTSDGRAAQA